MRSTSPLALALLLVTGCAPPTFDPETCSEGTRVGDCAPGFEVLDEDGQAVRLSDFEGEVVVAVFGEMWCPLCQELSVELEGLWQERQADGLVVIAVFDQDASGDTPEPDEAADFAGFFDLSFPILIDPEGEISERYDFGLQRPEAFVFDRKQLIRHRSSGNMPGTFSDIEAEATSLLATSE